MRRREVRSAIEGPRPTAAWVMSLVATATLWISEQLPPWIIAIQGLAFSVSFFTRHDPPAFRRSAIWLNVFMAGITTATIRAALDGNPATISLAYFTALALGLQLLDARPRKSEFVLVALALFQVILASNLTDSVLFPPLVIVFLASVTWTLVVHTLSMEAIESGDPAALPATISPDLRRMTAIATAACLILAVVIFVLFPRLKTNLLGGGSGAGLALSGFSDHVSLGDVGRIRKDHSVVLRVEGLDGEQPDPANAYWRGLAFDEFDGRDWSISHAENVAARKAISGIGHFGIDLRPESPGAPFVQRIVQQIVQQIVQRIIREPVASSVLFVPGTVQRIEGSFQQLERDRNDGLYIPARGDDRIRYTIWVDPTERDPERLREDRAASPMEASPGGERPTARYLQLPEVDPLVLALAARIVDGAETDFDRALRIQQSLRRNGRYTDSPPPLGDEDRSPIEAFLLGELEGHCEYFASAMVVLARAEGLPSRLVNGFAGGVLNEIGGFVEVTQADAHAWVEIHFEKAGWVRFDPTPPDLRLRAHLEGSLWAQFGQFGSTVELWWFQRVVDFDSVDQIGTLRGLWLTWSEYRTTRREAAGDPTSSLEHTWSRPNLGLDAALGLLGAALLVILLILWRRRRNRENSRIPEAYRQALRLLARRGLVRSEATSARAFARCVSARIPDLGGAAFDEITAGYLEERFGEREAVDLERPLRVLKDTVDRMRLRDHAHVG